MKKRTIAIVGAGLSLAAPVLVASGTAFAGQQDAATGGGQVLIGTRGGAGDTIAFTAQGTSTAAKGQVQYVDRSADGQTVMHGTVSCIDVMDNVAKIAGTWRDGGTFNLYVEDNGEGATATGEDVVTVLPGDPMCDFDEPGDQATALARGNAQVRDRG